MGSACEAGMGPALAERERWVQWRPDTPDGVGIEVGAAGVASNTDTEPEVYVGFVAVTVGMESIIGGAVGSF